MLPQGPLAFKLKSVSHSRTASGVRSCLGRVLGGARASLYPLRMYSMLHRGSSARGDFPCFADILGEGVGFIEQSDLRARHAVNPATGLQPEKPNLFSPARQYSCGVADSLRRDGTEHRVISRHFWRPWSRRPSRRSAAVPSLARSHASVPLQRPAPRKAAPARRRAPEAARSLCGF